MRASSVSLIALARVAGSYSALTKVYKNSGHH